MNAIERRQVFAVARQVAKDKPLREVFGKSAPSAEAARSEVFRRLKRILPGTSAGHRDQLIWELLTP